MNKEVKTTKRVFNLVIVDESGSMSFIERESLAGINETINTCKKMKEAYPEMEQFITLITFDSGHFKVHHDIARIGDATLLTEADYNPCGATPLYDAIGKGIAMMNAHTDADDKVLVTIITDGEENCSKEYNLTMVNKLITKLKKQNWTFTLIGTDNLDVEGMAGAMAIDNHLTFVEDPEETKKMFAKERKARSKFNCCIAMDMSMPEASYFKED